MKRIIDFLGKILKWFEDFVLVYMLLISVIAVTIDVILRAIHIQGFSWLQEANTYYMAILTFIGSGAAVMTDGHLKVDMIFRLLPGRPTMLIKGCINVMCSAVMFFITYYSFYWMQKLVLLGTKSTSLKIPMYFMWGFYALAFLAIAVRMIIKAVMWFKQFANAKKEAK